MRPQVVLVLLLATIVVLGGTALVKHHPDVIPAVISPDTVSGNPAVPVPELIKSSIPLAKQTVTPPQSPEKHQATVDAELDRISDATGKNDATSVSIIMADITSPDKEVRLAAIEAVKQSDDPDIIPTLRADAESAPDLQTQDALLQAADFLSLPDATTVAANGTSQTPEQVQVVQQKLAALQAQPRPQNHNHGVAPATPGN